MCFLFSLRLSKVLIGVVVAAVLSGVGAGATFASSCHLMRPANPGVDNWLWGVTAISARNLWAVGNYDFGDPYLDPIGSRTLIEYWNGREWSVQPSPSPSDSELDGVAASTPRNAWAVGESGAGSAETRPLIENWNGKVWKIQRRLRFNGWLNGVVAISARNAWAVGAKGPNDGPVRALIVHWNGRGWKVQRNPSPRKFGTLYSVDAISSDDVLAVGEVVEHWDGKVWKIVPGPNRDAVFKGVTGISSRSALAADEGGKIAEWDGNTWRFQPTRLFGELAGIAASSSTNAWAVGMWHEESPFIEHWNGRAWRRQPTPMPPGSFPLDFDAVATTHGSRTAWMVGDYGTDLEGPEPYEIGALVVRCTSPRSTSHSGTPPFTG